MAARRKTAAKQADETKVPDEGPHYLDRFGHRHEISDEDADIADEPPLPALPPAS